MMSFQSHALVLLSGGIDSAACAHLLGKQGHLVSGLFIDFGQRAATQELLAAKRISAELKISLDLMTVRGGKPVGVGEITGRNAFLVTLALTGGYCAGPGVIALGIHTGTSYYDCTPAFVATIDRLVAEYTDGCRRVIAPFLNQHKRDLISYFVREGLPLESTYSCEFGERVPCGKCPSCRDRGMSTC